MKSVESFCVIIQQNYFDPNEAEILCTKFANNLVCGCE